MMCYFHKLKLPLHACFVDKARHRDSGEVVALKKLRMEKERDGMPVTSVREVWLLPISPSCRSAFDLFQLTLWLHYAPDVDFDHLLATRGN